MSEFMQGVWTVIELVRALIIIPGIVIQVGVMLYALKLLNRIATALEGKK